MIEPLTPVVELQSRLGRVGSIQAWDPWRSRQSVAHAKWWVSKIASLSYGNDAAKNPEALFQSIVDRGHLSCLEFVPMLENDEFGLDTLQRALPVQSLRALGSFLPDVLSSPHFWGEGKRLQEERKLLASTEYSPTSASAFLVECPLYIRSQWMRHRSFSYLEMSRRYTKGTKVEWEFYGDSPIGETDGRLEPVEASPDQQCFWGTCEAEYQRRLDAGWPNEIARGCMPVEAMTRFWCAGFDRDWDAFCKLRQDPHAQPEIRVFADWIREQIGHGPF